MVGYITLLKFIHHLHQLIKWSAGTDVEGTVEKCPKIGGKFKVFSSTNQTELSVSTVILSKNLIAAETKACLDASQSATLSFADINVLDFITNVFAIFAMYSN